VSWFVAEMAEMRNDLQPNPLDAIVLIGFREMPKSDTATDHGVDKAVKPVPGRGQFCGGCQALRAEREIDLRFPKEWKLEGY